MKKVLLSESEATLVTNCEPNTFYLLVMPNKAESLGEEYYLLSLMPGSSVRYIFTSLSHPSWGTGFRNENFFGEPGEFSTCLTAALESGGEIYQFPSLAEMCVGIAGRYHTITTGGEIPEGGSISIKTEKSNH